MFRILKESNALHDKLMDNVTYFRDKMLAAGFDIKPTQSAICAVMLYDAKLSQDFAARMQEEGIYVTGFYYPVVPKGQARIRVQLSAGHEREHLDRAIAAFIKVGKELGVVNDRLIRLIEGILISMPAFLSGYVMHSYKNTFIFVFPRNRL